MALWSLPAKAQCQCPPAFACVCPAPEPLTTFAPSHLALGICSSVEVAECIESSAIVRGLLLRNPVPHREEGDGGCTHLTAGKSRLKDGQSVAQGRVGDSGRIMYQSFLTPKLSLSSLHPFTALDFYTRSRKWSGLPPWAIQAGRNV